ncbi:MAG TPA: T9SS type A sorting domain-containing protein [Saprospiraceae bacterium]|nr:T9SS type A sorting domain-containing protein [Saprospiraceae bacterium]
MIVFAEENDVTIVSKEINSCFRLSRINSEFFSNDIFIARYYDCDPTPPKPVIPCDVIIEFVVHATQEYVDEMGGYNEAQKRIDAIISEAENIWRETGVIQHFKLLNALNFRQNHIIVHDQNYHRSEAWSALATRTNQELPCTQQFVDLNIFLTLDADVNGYYHGPNSCLSSGIKLLGMVLVREYGKSAPIRSPGRTLAHEIGHFMAGADLENLLNSGIACAPDCSLAFHSLMCSTGGNIRAAAMLDNCNHGYIYDHLTENCSCYSDQHNFYSPCAHCLFSSITSNSNPNIIAGCSSLSESTLSIEVWNDCDIKENKRIVFILPNGGTYGGSSYPKFEVSSLMDYESVGTYTGPAPEFTTYLLVRSPLLTLQPEEKRKLSVKVKLVDLGTKSNVFKWGPTYYWDSPVLNSSVEIGRSTHDLLRPIQVTSANNNVTKLLQDPNYIISYNNGTACLTSEKPIHLKTDFTIDQSHYFKDQTWIIDPGVKIIVNSNKTAGYCNGKLLSCAGVWDKIVMGSGSKLLLSESSVSNLDGGIQVGLNSTFEMAENSILSASKKGIEGSISATNALIKIVDSKIQGIKETGIKIYNGNQIFISNSDISDMEAGVVAINTDVRHSARFFNIGSSRGDIITSEPYNGNAISMIGNGAQNIYAATLGSSSLFKNFNAGIYINNSHYSIVADNMKDCNYGIYVTNTPLSGNILYTDIEAKRNAIHYNYNGNLSSAIKWNILKTTDPFQIGVVITGNHGNLDIIENNVEAESGEAALLCSGSSNVKIQENNIWTYTSNGIHTDALKLINSNQVTASCNSLGNFALGTGTAAMYVEATINGTYQCNGIYGGDNGLQFVSSCQPSSISGNNISDHEVGLMYSSQAAGSDAITGPQNHQGNMLSGAGWTKDAWNLGSPVNNQQSQFLVSPTSPFIPSNIAELVSINFFKQPIPSSEFNCEIGNVCKSSRSKIAQNELPDYLLNSNLELDNFSDARSWSARFAILASMYQSNIHDEISTQWRSRFQKSIVNQFAQIYSDLFAKAKNAQEIYQLVKSKQNYIEKNLNVDWNYIHELTDKITNLHTAFTIPYKEVIRAHRSVLNSMKCEPVYEENMRLVLLALCDKVLGESEVKHHFLNAIAESCPYSDGPAVYIARDLLGQNDRIYDDVKYCGLRTNQDNKSKVESKEFSVYPNPIQEFLTIKMPTVWKGKACTLQIVNVTGKLIIEIPYAFENKIDLSDLASGLYFIIIKDDPKYICKFVKQN